VTEAPHMRKVDALEAARSTVSWKSRGGASESLGPGNALQRWELKVNGEWCGATWTVRCRTCLQPPRLIVKVGPLEGQAASVFLLLPL
jgi:hypothetical protein